MTNEKRHAGQPKADIKALAKENKELFTDEYYTIYEVADILKLHERTIRNNIKRGTIKAKKIGKSWRIRKSDILWKEKLMTLEE